jgi:hypothetical protein
MRKLEKKLAKEAEMACFQYPPKLGHFCITGSKGGILPELILLELSKIGYWFYTGIRGKPRFFI